MKLNKMKSRQMTMKFNFIFASFISLMSLDASSTTHGCALLSLGEHKAKKIAKIRAESEFVKINKGIYVSGKESVLISESDVLYERSLSITQKSSGLSSYKLNVIYKKGLIDDKEYLCAFVQE